MTGESDEDELISATKSVASSTTSLLIACNVKAEWRSKANERLQVRRGRKEEEGEGEGRGRGGKGQGKGREGSTSQLLHIIISAFIQVTCHSVDIPMLYCTHTPHTHAHKHTHTFRMRVLV